MSHVIVGLIVVAVAMAGIPIATWRFDRRVRHRVVAQSKKWELLLFALKVTVVESLLGDPLLILAFLAVHGRMSIAPSPAEVPVQVPDWFEGLLYVLPAVSLLALLGVGVLEIRRYAVANASSRRE